MNYYSFIFSGYFLFSFLNNIFPENIILDWQGFFPFGCFKDVTPVSLSLVSDEKSVINLLFLLYEFQIIKSSQTFCFSLIFSFLFFWNSIYILDFFFYVFLTDSWGCIDFFSYLCSFFSTTGFFFSWSVFEFADFSVIILCFIPLSELFCFQLL